MGSRLKWTRTEGTVGKRALGTGLMIYTAVSGSMTYRIEQRKYVLPHACTAYVLFIDGVRFDEADLLADAKALADEFNDEREPHSLSGVDLAADFRAAGLDPSNVLIAASARIALRTVVA